MQMCMHYVCQVRQEDAQLKGSSVRIELVQLCGYAMRVARVCNWTLTGFGVSILALREYAMLSALCLASQTGGSVSSVRIEAFLLNACCSSAQLVLVLLNMIMQLRVL